MTVGCDDSSFLLEPVDDSIVEETENRVDVYLFDKSPNLDLDNNGYYHLDINMGSWQTLHRISGFIIDSTSTIGDKKRALSVDIHLKPPAQN